MRSGSARAGECLPSARLSSPRPRLSQADGAARSPTGYRYAGLLSRLLSLPTGSRATLDREAAAHALCYYSRARLLKRTPAKFKLLQSTYSQTLADNPMLFALYYETRDNKMPLTSGPLTRVCIYISRPRYAAVFVTDALRMNCNADPAAIT